ncbi:MAG: RNA-protein complex protein Nop10 [Candidatus Poseidoniia archaeon]|nr:RNA-protein complex protein Nop10 [Candidatus Poseidoniia archaeon]
MSRHCPKCSKDTSNPLPPRFSPQDKYGKYRRMLGEK